MNITQDKPEGKAEVQKELEEGLEVLIQNNIDLILVEVFTIFHHSKMKDWIAWYLELFNDWLWLLSINILKSSII